MSKSAHILHLEMLNEAVIIRAEIKRARKALLRLLIANR